MRITIVLGPFQPLPPEGFGAVEKVWHELAQEFARAGNEVVLVGKGAESAAGHETGIRAVLLGGYSASPRLWLNLVKDFLYAVKVMHRVERSDVIVTNSFWTPVLLSLFARGRGRVIVHVARFPKGQMWLYRGAAALQAISSAVAHAIERQSPAAKGRVFVLPYPVDLQVYRPPAAPRGYDGELTVLYVGRVHPEKGVDLLVAAFREFLRRVPRARLRVIGPSDPAQGGGGADYLEALKAASAGMPVEFVGAVREPALLAQEYQRAHCFCYPSVAEEGEALGLAVLEAMATGLPVVISDLACFRDFVRDGRDGFVFDHRAPQPALALGKVLVQTLQDTRRAIQLGRSAAERAREFELKRVATRYVEFFAQVLRG